MLAFGRTLIYVVEIEIEIEIPHSRGRRPITRNFAYGSPKRITHFRPRHEHETTASGVYPLYTSELSQRMCVKLRTHGLPWPVRPAYLISDTVLSVISSTSGQSNLTKRPHRRRMWTLQWYSPGGASVHPT